MAQEYPYTPVPAKMEELLKKLPNLGIPEKANQAWMKGLGYTSSNDRQTLTALRTAGMISGTGAPTDFYRAVRSRNRSKVAGFVKGAYRDLFSTYPDADRKDAEALQNFFRSRTSAGDKVQRLMVRTFQIFCSLGDFESSTEAESPEEDDAESNGSGERGGTGSGSPKGSLTLNVNIQLQLPPDAKGEVYEKLFEAMGKHLKGLSGLE